MAVTEISNATSHKLTLKVGSNKVYRTLTALAPNEMYGIHVDFNDTYQEFLLTPTTRTGEDEVLITSDDCVDYCKMNIVEKNGKLTFEGVQRRQTKPTEESTGGFMRIPVISLRFEMRWRERKVSLLFGLDGPQ